MRPAVLAVALVACLAPTACAAVIGIDTVTLDETDASTASTDGGGGGDASKPAADAGGSDARPPPADAASACSGDRPTCLKCCRQGSMAALPTLEEAMRSTGCYCGAASGSCQSECATSACASPAQPPSGSCVQCEDGLLKGSTCSAAFAQCKGDPSCGALLDCIAACP